MFKRAKLCCHYCQNDIPKWLIERSMNQSSQRIVSLQLLIEWRFDDSDSITKISVNLTRIDIESNRATMLLDADEDSFHFKSLMSPASYRVSVAGIDDQSRVGRRAQASFRTPLQGEMITWCNADGTSIRRRSTKAGYHNRLGCRCSHPHSFDFIVVRDDFAAAKANTPGSLPAVSANPRPMLMSCHSTDKGLTVVWKAYNPDIITNYQIRYRLIPTEFDTSDDKKPQFAAT